jgi:hypothetical protein
MRKVAWIKRDEDGTLDVKFGHDIKKENHWITQARKIRYEIWYVNPSDDRERFFNPILPDPKHLKKSHTKVANYLSITNDLEKIYYDMQGECWSPQGEARDLIKNLKLHHTTMSTGDVIKTPDDKLFMVGKVGFVALTK